MTDDLAPEDAQPPVDVPDDLEAAIRAALPDDVTSEFRARFGDEDDPGEDDLWDEQSRADILALELERRMPLVSMQLESAGRLVDDALRSYSAAAITAVGLAAGLVAGRDGFVLLRGYGGGSWRGSGYETAEAIVVEEDEVRIINGESTDGPIVRYVASQLYDALHRFEELRAGMEFLVVWPDRAVVLAYRCNDPGDPFADPTRWRPYRPAEAVLLTGTPEPCGQCADCADLVDTDIIASFDAYDRRYRKYVGMLADVVREHLQEPPLVGRYDLGAWTGDLPLLDEGDNAS